MAVALNINGRKVALDVPDDTPLLWAVRDELDLKGTKFGCGIGMCGACTVHLDGQAVRSCSVPLAAVAGRQVQTIEGLGSAAELSPVQQAWLEENVSQCGYCQPGFIMAVTAFLETNPAPTDEDIDRAISNICRCGSYPRIRKAIHRAAELQRAAG